MMNFTYFLTPDEVKANGMLNANVDTEYIEPSLQEAQDVYLREIIGDSLYNAIENRINNNNLTDQYNTLVEQYIKPYLGYKLLSLIVFPINFKMRNMGVVTQYGEGVTTATMKDVAYLADYYNNRVEFYENRMTAYLTKNAADFPEYGYSSQNITNPSQTHTAGTIYLGGGRKRSCGLKTGSGGGSTDRVDWNDIQNKPNFATVATSGSYNDLQNRPQINNATLTIKQGGTVKGTFSANANENVDINLESGGGGSVNWNDIQNKPDFAPVAESGDYNDLSNRPYIPDMDEYVDVETFNARMTSIRNQLDDKVDEGTYNQGMNNVNTALENRVTYGVYTPKIEAIDNTLGDKVDTVALCTINNERLDTRGNFELVRTDSIATLTIKQGGTTKGTFTPNSGTDVEINLESGGGGGSTDWSDITNKPNFATVATSGSYTDLNNKPTIPTKTSELTNDSGFTTFSGSYNDLRDIPNYFSYFGNNISANGVKLSGQTQFGDSLDTDISNGVFCNFKVDKAQSTKLYTDYIITGENTAGASELIVEGDDGNNVYGKIAKDGIYEGTDKLSDKYLQITNLPTNVSAFTNDAGYLTQHQSLAGYATETWVQQQGYSTFSGSYNDLSDKPSIPAAQVQSDWNAVSGMGQILNKPSLATVATSGDYNDLQNKPTIPAAQVQSDWNAVSGMGQILNKPSMTAETWVFTVDDGQGGTTTVTKTVWLQ